MITKDLLLAALKDGMDYSYIRFLLDEAVEAYEFERQNDPGRKALMDGMMAYVGPDHDLWNEIDPWDALEILEDVLEELIVENTPVANCTEQKCDCSTKCSCDEKIEENSPKVIGKIVVNENGKRVEKDLTAKDVDEVLDSWLSFTGLK